MAYVTATLVQKDPPGDDRRVHIVVEFVGNAGEPTVKREYYVAATDTLQSVRQWAIAQAASLAAVKTVADNLTVGMSVNLTPIVPPAPTARQVWLGKVSQYKQFAALGLTGTAAADLAALLADINATYETGFLQ
jgi:hypothetical protein